MSGTSVFHISSQGLSSTKALQPLLEVQGQARVKCVIEGILDLLIMPRCGLYAKVLEGGEASSTAETQSRAAQASSPRLDCGRRRLPESVVAIGEVPAEAP